MTPCPNPECGGYYPGEGLVVCRCGSGWADAGAGAHEAVAA